MSISRLLGFSPRNRNFLTDGKSNFLNSSLAGFIPNSQIAPARVDATQAAPGVTEANAEDTQMPYAATVDQVTRGLDPVTQQLLFGLDGEGGFIPGAMRAAERTFFDDEGNPVVIPEQVADFTQDQLDAFQLARSGVGSEGRFLSDAEAAYRSGIGSLTSGLERGLGVTEDATRRFKDDLTDVRDIMRGTTRGYDPSMTEQFYNPYPLETLRPEENPHLGPERV